MYLLQTYNYSYKRYYFHFIGCFTDEPWSASCPFGFLPSLVLGKKLG